jgi:hypothetical protein
MLGKNEEEFRSAGVLLLEILSDNRVILCATRLNLRHQQSSNKRGKPTRLFFSAHAPHQTSVLLTIMRRLFRRICLPLLEAQKTAFQ